MSRGTDSPVDTSASALVVGTSSAARASDAKYSRMEDLSGRLRFKIRVRVRVRKVEVQD